MGATDIPRPQAVVQLVRSEQVSNHATHPAPDFLTDLATKAWNRLMPFYDFAAYELPEFAAYCEAIAELEECCGLIEEGGLITVDPSSGMPIPSPVTTVRAGADRRIASWANRFKGNLRGSAG